MVLIGSFVNGLAVFLCALLGALLKSRLPKRLCDTVMHGMALCIVVIGIDGAISGGDTLITIISLALGGVLGELIDIDRHLNRFGAFLQRKLIKDEGSRFGEGFVSATLLICVGAWAITGAMDAGLRGEHSSFYAKAAVDGVACLVMATTLGVGVAVSGISVFLYQGSLAMLSTLIAPYLTDAVITQMSCVGSLLIVAIGLNMLGLIKIKVVNLLPSVFIAAICVFIV